MAEQNPPSGNKIWLNDGSGNFIDSGWALGKLDKYGAHGALGVSLGDLDGDGDLDAFVANAGPNKVWINNSLHE